MISSCFSKASIRQTGHAWDFLPGQWWCLQFKADERRNVIVKLSIHTHQNQPDQSENFNTGEPEFKLSEHSNAKKVDEENYSNFDFHSNDRQEQQYSPKMMKTTADCLSLCIWIQKMSRRTHPDANVDRTTSMPIIYNGSCCIDIIWGND
jgi:hypothetical protein